MTRPRHRLTSSALVAVATLACVGAPTSLHADVAAEAPKAILDLQQFRSSASVPIVAADGRRGVATLTQINPRINAWLLLTLDWSAPAEHVAYHLENAAPRTQQVTLSEADGLGVRISTAAGDTHCALWSADASDALQQARHSGLPYAPLCGGALYLRNAVPGTYTQLERVTNFLRDHVWGGDRIVTFVREQFFKDAFVERATPRPAIPEDVGAVTPADAPSAALIDVWAADDAIVPEHVGLDLGAATHLVLGRWYPVSGAPGIFVSAIEPRAVAAEILNSARAAVNPLDPVESQAVAYLVAFDLTQFELGFALGTDHPRLGWSPRALPEVVDAALRGPDGIDAAAPLVRSGMINPAQAASTAAAFVGGFKREHGAFKYGPLAHRNRGSHYGFIEQGAVFSTLQPELATVYVLDDGSIDMKTWTQRDDALLPRIRHARQNGVPLIEYDPATGRSVPGALVKLWGPGNWSGSADENLRTLRAGLCLQQASGRDFLIYGYFSTATPSAMARVFQAYGCRYAMHLDMNALEHTYLAVYVRRNGELLIQHLIDGMAVVDRKGGSALAPRFLGFPDDRDFFYLTRRPQS